MFNNKGMSLVSALVAAGIVAGIGLFIAKISNTSAKVTRGARNQLDIYTFQTRITNALFTRDLCTNFLAGQIPLTTDNSNSNLNSSLVQNGNVILQNNMQVPGTRYTVTTLQVLDVAPHGQHLKVVLTKDQNDPGYGSSLVTKRFPLSLTMNGLIIESCHSDESEAIDSAVEIAEETVCEQMLGGNYDSNTGCDVQRVPLFTQEIQVYGRPINVLSTTPSFWTSQCSRCGGNCSPQACPAGYLQPGSVNCRRSGNCGWNRWRNCTRTCQKDPNQPDGYAIMPDSPSSAPPSVDGSDFFRWTCIADVSVIPEGGRWDLGGSATPCTPTAADDAKCSDLNDSSIGDTACCDQYGPDSACVD